MTVEAGNLSVSSSFERTESVSLGAAVQGQSSPESKQGKERRRLPPPEEVSARPVEEDGEPPLHRVDSLA
jgi:hypothetical protein